MAKIHPKHKSLYFDEHTGKWELKHTRPRSTECCPVAWCKNVPAFRYRNGRLYVDLHCNKCRSRRYRANHPVKYAFLALKDSAKKRSIQFNLTYHEFKLWCEETGYANDKGTYRLTNHCDRIRHTEGYHINNIQVLTESENIRKRNLDLASTMQEPPDIELPDDNEINPF